MCRVAVLGVVWLLYLLSPLDLIPEAVFGIVGLLDDLVIFVLIAMYLTFFFRSVLSCLLSPSFCPQPPASCPPCLISLTSRQIMANMGENLPAGVNQ